MATHSPDSDTLLATSLPASGGNWCRPCGGGRDRCSTPFAPNVKEVNLTRSARNMGEVMLADVVQSNFPDGVRLPKCLRSVCDYLDAHGYPVSGCFEICDWGRKDAE